MINCTPHTVTVRSVDGANYIFPVGFTVARVEMISTPSDPLEDGCPTSVCRYGAADLPPGERGERYIVSTMFADAYRRQHGDDGVELFVPDSGPDAIRENGQIVAVRRLIRR